MFEKIIRNDRSLLHHFHRFYHLVVHFFILYFQAAVGDQAEVMPHDDVPLLQLVKHLDLLDFQPFILVDVVVITEVI